MLGTKQFRDATDVFQDLLIQQVDGETFFEFGKDTEEDEHRCNQADVFPLVECIVKHLQIATSKQEFKEHGITKSTLKVHLQQKGCPFGVGLCMNRYTSGVRGFKNFRITEAGYAKLAGLGEGATTGKRKSKKATKSASVVDSEEEREEESDVMEE